CSSDLENDDVRKKSPGPEARERGPGLDNYEQSDQQRDKADRGEGVHPGENHLADNDPVGFTPAVQRGGKKLLQRKIAQVEDICGVGDAVGNLSSSPGDHWASLGSTP